MEDNRRRQADFPLTVITIILVLTGVIMVYNASYPTAGKEYYYRQMIFAVVGLLFMFGMMNVPYWWLRSIAKGFLWLSVVGLVLVLVPGIGHMVNGAYRWIRIGPIQIQPSEFAKFGLVLYMASLLGDKVRAKKDVRDWQHSFFPLALPILVISLLVLKEPDMGTAIVIVGTALALFYMAGVRLQDLAGISALGVLGAVVLILSEEYRRQRILAFLDPFKDYYGMGYQVCQSLIALGSGGINGMGFGEGRQKLGFLPENHTDFIYAVFGQEFGWIGAALLAGLFLFFAVRGLSIALSTKDPFGRLLAAGLSIMIAGQALLNMLVVTSSVPATGVPLPFISYGGSSLALNLLSVGVLLGVSRYPREIECYDNASRANRRRDGRARVSRTQYRRSSAR